MKLYNKSILLVLFLIIFLASCKSDQSKSYRAYYQNINKEYAKAREASALLNEQGEGVGTNDPARDELAALEKELAEAQAEAQANREAMEKAFPKSGSDEQEPVKKSPKPRYETSKPAKAEPKPQPSQRIEESMNVIFRESEITPAKNYENVELKKYNVVIATLSREEGVERLKRSLNSSGENLIVVKNNSGLYSVLMGTYDTREESLAKRRDILSKYSERQSKEELMSRYEIPFSDTWILIKK